MKTNHEQWRQQQKNREKQERYREKLKLQNIKRVTLVLKKDTFDRIKDIARSANLSQGEVVDRVFKGGCSNMNNSETEESKARELDEHWEDFALRESAIDTIAIMLGNNLNDIMEEEAKTSPDFQKIEELEKRGDKLYDERNRIYFGDKELMQYVEENYVPIIRKRYSVGKVE